MLQELAQEAGATLGYEIDLARLFSEFQDTYEKIKQTHGPLADYKDKTGTVLKSP